MLQRWAFVNALAVAGTLALTLYVETPAPLLLAGGGALGWLVFRFRGLWTPDGGFGLANSVTAARCLGTLLLPSVFAAFGGVAAIVLVLALLAADGIDGRLARTRDEASAFGEFFDKETDAFMLLLICVLLYLSGRLGAWILLPGGLRYLFVIVTYVGRPQVVKEQRLRFGGFVYVLTVCGLLAAFLPWPALYVPLTLGATLLLSLSFARSFWLFFTPA